MEKVTGEKKQKNVIFKYIAIFRVNVLLLDVCAKWDKHTAL